MRPETPWTELRLAEEPSARAGIADHPFRNQPMPDEEHDHRADGCANQPGALIQPVQAWPTNVARNAPTMPSTVVNTNPEGLLGPGASSRAINPAIKPMMMIQSMFTTPCSFVFVPYTNCKASRSFGMRPCVI